MGDSGNKTCDRCGVEIPDSRDRAMSDVDTYWCDACEAGPGETMEQLDQRLADRRTLGVGPRPDDRVL